MAVARIAAVFFALLSVELSAQPAPQGSVTVQVTDRSGAVVPGARIEVDPSFSKPGSVFSTDSQGQAALELSEGSHVLSVVAPGFAKWMRSMNVQSGGGQVVTARLELEWAESGGPIVASPPDIPLGRPEPVFLLPRPMLVLDPLPLRGVKRRW